MHRTEKYILGICILVVLGLLIGPAIPRLSDHLLGFESVDHYGTQWFYWFAWLRFTEGGESGWTDLFFYPWGKDIYGHTGANLLDAWLAIPFRALFGPTLGYNLFVLSGLSASAWAFYRFIRHFTEDLFACALSTLLFSCSPFILYELVDGRPTQAILLFPLLFLHALWQSGEQKGWKAPLWAGFWLALSGYQYWYYAFFGGFMALGAGLWRSFSSPADRLPILGRHALMAAVALLICLPGTWALVTATLQSGEVPGLLDTDQWDLSDTPPVTREGTSIGLFLWEPLTLAAGYYVRDDDGLTERFLPSLYPTPLLLLPAWLLWLRRPGRLKRGPMLAALGAAVLLGAGPMLVVWDHVLPNPVYLVLAKALAFLRRLWWPGRVVGLVTILQWLPLGVAISGLRRSWLWGGLATGAALMALLTGALAPIPSWDASIPAGYQCLATGPKGAVLELPFAWTQAHLYYQVYHGRPIYGGMIEDNPTFSPPEALTLRKENSFVHRLLDLSRLNESTEEWTEADKKAVYDLGYRYIVLQKDAFASPPDAKPIQRSLVQRRLRLLDRNLLDMLGRPVFSDFRVNIYAPWGDPAPCSMDPALLDRESRMVPLNDPVARMGVDPSQKVITRVFGGPVATTPTTQSSDAADATGAVEVKEEATPEDAETSP